MHEQKPTLDSVAALAVAASSVLSSTPTPDEAGEEIEEIELAPDALEKAAEIEDLEEPPAPILKRGHAVLVRRRGATWIATGVRGHTLQVYSKDICKKSHYFSALGRKRG